MSLRRTVAVPFRQRGRTRMDESEFVVSLSLDREWFSPDQAKRVVDVAVSEGLLERDDDDLQVSFDPGSVTVPDGFVPDESILQRRGTFERVLDAVVEAGVDKREAVAAINARQRDLDVTVEAAAVVYANRRGIDVSGFAERAKSEL